MVRGRRTESVRTTTTTVHLLPNNPARPQPESVTEATGPELQLPMRGGLWGYDGNGSNLDVVAQLEAIGVQTADERSNFQLGTCC